MKTLFKIKAELFINNNSLLFQMVETLFSSLSECMWKSPVELAQLEAIEKERRLTEEIETLKSPLDSSSLLVQGSNSEGKIMGSNSLGEWE